MAGGTATLASFSDLIASYQSGLGVTTNAGGLEAWEDQAGVSYTVDTGSATRGLVLNAADQNGLDTYGPGSTAASDAAPDTNTAGLNVPEADLASSDTDPVTIALVAAVPTGSTQSLFGITNAMTTSTIVWATLGSQQIVLRIRTTAGPAAAVTYNFGDNGYHTIMATCTQTSTELFVDGISRGTYTANDWNPATGNDRVISVGKESPGSTAMGNAKIGQLAVWAADHNERSAQIHGILARKWGL